MGDGFYRSKDPTNSIKVLKEIGAHRIPYFRIQPDPDLNRIQRLWIRPDPDLHWIRIFTRSGSGCNLIRIKAELQPMRISKHRTIKDKTIL